jgi:succinyl-diaminopimelate desuccinylase
MPLDEKAKREIIDTYCRMISIKSVSPLAGGDGEGKRAGYLESVLISWGLKPKRFTYIDESKAERTSLITKKGDKEKTLWILAHIDTVSEGDPSLWKTDPFTGVVKDGKIYGRGTSDNGQAVIAGMYALKFLIDKETKYNYGLILVADEEIGSKYGMQKLMNENLFGKGDIFLVPDSGNAEGSEIEIEEKSILWLKITVTGKQVHASTPWLGLNAFREAMRFALEADDFLHKKYNKTTKLMPQGSTFEMTKHEKNVDSTNIIPGTEVFYFDCRVVPQYDVDEIVSDLNKLAENYKADIKIEVANKEQAAPPTKEDSEIVKLLEAQIRERLGAEPKLVAIGGGTVAAFLRRAGFDTAVWGIEDRVAHQPNEYAELENLYKMIDVFEGLFLQN